MIDAISSMAAAKRRLVWDLPLRLFHWVFACGVVACWATANIGYQWMKWHIWLGYAMMTLVFFRVGWGFAGPRHARFSSFLVGPSRVFRYVRDFRDVSHAARSVGHNPLGGLMVLLMLALAALQVATGLFASDDITWAGPYSGSVSGAAADIMTSLHHRVFNVMWIAIGLHIGAICYYAVVKKNNLVPAMLSGYKPAELVPIDQAIDGSQFVKAAVLLALSAIAVFAIVRAAPPAAGMM